MTQDHDADRVARMLDAIRACAQERDYEVILEIIAFYQHREQSA
jgi:hypothetical protein